MKCIKIQNTCEAYKLGVKRRCCAQVADSCRGILREDVQHLLLCNGQPVRLIYSSCGAGDGPGCVMQKSAAVSSPCSNFVKKGFWRRHRKTLFLLSKGNEGQQIFVREKIIIRCGELRTWIQVHCSAHNILDATSLGEEFVLTLSVLRTLNIAINDAISAAKVALEWSIVGLLWIVFVLWLIAAHSTLNV
jgi:hypothetical protein